MNLMRVGPTGPTLIASGSTVATRAEIGRGTRGSTPLREPGKRSNRARFRERRPRRLAVLTAATLGLAACSTGGGTATAPTQADRTATSRRSTTTLVRTTTTTEPRVLAFAGCPDPTAVEEVVGQPVDQTSSGGSHSGTGLSYSYQGCGYDLTGGDGSVGITRITLADDGPGSPFERLDKEARNGFAQDSFKGFTIGEFAAFSTGDMLVVDEGKLPLRVTSEHLGLDPAAEEDLRVALAQLALG